MPNLRKWSQSASGNASVAGGVNTINWQEGQAPSTVNNSAREEMAQIRRVYRPDEWGWVECSATASVASQTTFKLTGDQTSDYTATRRVRLTGGSVTMFGTIVSSSFTAETTVTLTKDSGSLSASMSIAAVSAMYDKNTGLSTASTTEVLTGTDTSKAVTPDALAALWELGASVSATATISLGEGGYFYVTGNPGAGGITDIDFSVPKDGREAICVFTGSATLTHNATTLLLPGNANIVTQAGDIARFVQDSTDNIRCVGYQRGNGQPLFLPRGHIDGLILANNGTDANNDIDIAAGQATSDDGSYLITLSSSITKQIDAAWAVGTNQGGLDGTESVAGTPDTSTWYHVWLIARLDTGVVDVLFSESATSPTMPTNYTKKRRIGSVFNNSSGDIRAFSQVGDEFVWSALNEDVDVVNPGTAAVSRTVLTPLGIKTIAMLHVGAYRASTAINLLVSPLDASDQAPTTSTTADVTVPATVHGATDSSNEWNWVVANVRTNASSQVRTRAGASGLSDRIGIFTRGWIDPRGRDA